MIKIPAPGPASSKGFTLVELLLAIVIMGVTLALTSAMVFTARNKSILTRDLDEVYKVLEYARQQSISAYKGESYSVVFESSSVPNTLTVKPEDTVRSLHQASRLILPAGNQQYEVKFAKLFGTPNPLEPVTITLRSNGLEGSVHIDQSGYITLIPITQL